VLEVMRVRLSEEDRTAAVDCDWSLTDGGIITV